MRKACAILLWYLMASSSAHFGGRWSERVRLRRAFVVVVLSAMIVLLQVSSLPLVSHNGKLDRIKRKRPERRTSAYLGTHILLSDLDRHTESGQAGQQLVAVEVKFFVAVGIPGAIWATRFFDNAVEAGADLERVLLQHDMQFSGRELLSAGSRRRGNGCHRPNSSPALLGGARPGHFLRPLPVL